MKIQFSGTLNGSTARYPYLSKVRDCYTPYSTVICLHRGENDIVLIAGQYIVGGAVRENCNLIIGGKVAASLLSSTTAPINLGR